MIEKITMVERKENWPVRTYIHENLHTISGYHEMVQMTIINKHHCIILVITKRDTSNLTQAVQILKICVVIMTMNSHVKNSN